MAFDPLKLLKGALKIAADVTGLDTIGDIIGIFDAGNMTPEQQTALANHEIQLKELALRELETEIAAKVDLMKTEILSEDAYVRRARPTGLYISYIVSAGLAAALVFGVEVDAAAILTLIGPLMGFSGWYTYNRTKEKMNGAATSSSTSRH